MVFTLQDARLWDHIIRFVSRPPKLKEKSDNGEEKRNIFINGRRRFRTLTLMYLTPSLKYQECALT